MTLRKSLTASILFAVFPSLQVLALDPSAPTTCYFLGGVRRIDAGFRCNNATSGHSSCCAPGAICYSNGVCSQDTVTTADWLRLGCTDKTWTDPACLEQCTTYANGSAAGIGFCNSSDITKTNKYCCDDGKYGVGSFHCCQDPTSMFVINPIATILAQMPLSQLSTSTTSTTSTNTVASTTPTNPATTANAAPVQATSSSPATSDPANNDDKGSLRGAAIGAGIGVPVGVIGLGLMGLLAWRYRKKQARKEAQVEGGSVDGSGIGMFPGRTWAYGVSVSPKEMDGNAPVSEVDGGQGVGAYSGKWYYGGMKYNEEPPQELMSKNNGLGNGEVHEMDGRSLGR